MTDYEYGVRWNRLDGEGYLFTREPTKGDAERIAKLYKTARGTVLVSRPIPPWEVAE